MKKALSALLAVLMLLTMLPMTGIAAQAEIMLATASNEVVSGDYRYAVLSDGTAEIREYTGGTAVVSVPSEMDGYSVTSIGNYAFEGCTGLTSVVIPDSVASIGYEAFQDCTNLKSVTLGSGLKTLDSYAFRGTAITEITIPKSVTSMNSPFYGAEALKKVVFEDGMEAIPSSALSGCTSVEEVIIPDSVKTIGSSAFRGCTGLKNITIPDSVTEIGREAFSSSGLTSLDLPNSVTTIGESAFESCTGLTSVVIPDSVTSIGSYAFSNCESLENVRCCGKQISLGNNLFTNSENIVVYTIANSLIAVYCVDNDIAMILITDGGAEADDSVFETEKTRFECASQSVVNGVVTLNAKYLLKVSANASGTSLRIKLPKSASIIKNGVKVNGVVTDNYTYDFDNSSVTIPMNSAQEADVSITVQMNASYPILSYAQLNYRQNNRALSEIIGTISSSADMISITSTTKTADTKIAVQGIAPHDSTVSLYVDGECVGTTRASKTGIYSTNIVLKNPKEFQHYKIEAKADSSSGVISAETMVTYLKNNVSNELEEFKLYYRNQEIDLLKMNGTRPTISLSGAPMTFVVKPKGNSESYAEVNVVSTKGGQVKKISCKWDEEQKRYIGNGYFDESNRNYVPGEISVEFSTKKPVNVCDTTKDYASSDYQSSFVDCNLDEKMSTEIVSQTDNKITYKIHLNDTANTVIEQSIENEQLPNPATEIFAKDNDFVSIVDKAGVTYYTKLIFADEEDSSRAKNVLQIIKKNDTKLVSFFFDADVSQAYKYLKDTIYTPVDTYVGVLKDIYDGAKTDSEIADTIYRIERDMSLSPEERSTQLAFANSAYMLNGLSTIGTVALTAFAALGAITGPWLIAGGIICGALGYLAKEYNDALNGEDAFEAFFNSFSWLNWLVDPSGFVCEATASNRLEGVKTTLYCIPYDEDDADFWEKPNTANAVVWNANEYDQTNPLYTDSEGYYAWDVPEGWWQVKYEKEGYETTYSEWLPVPPPQMNVNIAMKTTQAPQMDLVIAHDDEVEFSFSQYMNISSISNETVKFFNNGVAISGSIVPLDAEESFEDSTVKLAKRFKFIPSQPNVITNETIITVNGVKNYTDINMTEEYRAKLQVEKKIDDFIVPNEITLTYGETGILNIAAEPKEAVAGKKVNISLSNSYVVETSTDVILDASGTAKIDLKALLPGNVTMTLSIDGTTIQKTVYLTVSLDDYDDGSHEHEWIEVSRTEPTCESDGKVTYVCRYDESHVKTEILKSTGHDYTEWTVAQEPSCTEDGRQVRVCRTCGTEFTEILPKLGHEVDESDWEIVKEPTATEDGLKVLKCQRCGEVVKEEIIPATGEAVEPTLTLTLDGQAVEGDVAYVKLPSILMLYKNHSATLGFQFDQDVEVASVKWSYANWSVSSPEANIESPDSAETVIRPNGKGIGARSTWVTLTVTDVNGNVYQQTVKVRFYKWDWQRK